MSAIEKDIPRRARVGTLAAVVAVGLGWLLVGAAASGAADAVSARYGPVLTWHGDPTTTMTVLWVRGPADPPANWRKGPAGFGYGDVRLKTQLADMRGRYQRVYLRKAFQLAQLPPGRKLGVGIRYNDGFIAYLNGAEICRRNVRGDGPRAGKIGEGGGEELFALVPAETRLRPGTNVIAIEGHNARIDSDDFVLDAYVTWLEGNQPVGQPMIPRGAEWDYTAGGDPRDGWKTIPFVLRPEPSGSAPRDERVWYRPQAGGAWREVEPAENPLRGTAAVVRYAPLTGLLPGTAYQFAIGADPPVANRDTPWFRTAPAQLTQPLRFVTGGDMYHTREWLDAMNHRAGQLDPLFALLGGDLAYANNADVQRWYQWLNSWRAHAVAPDGRLVPMVVTIGNHETTSGTPPPADTEPQQSRAKFYYSLFVDPRQVDFTWYQLDFGDYLSLWLLDSDHALPVAGAQTEWLAAALAAHDSRPHRFACYHKPAYGTAKPSSEAVRQHWVPLFEKYKLTAAFENDHHTYKRTHPLRQNKIDHQQGVLYLGDGAWGVGTREVKDPDAWYLAHAESRRHLILVTLDGDRQTYEAIDAEGHVFDRYGPIAGANRAAGDVPAGPAAADE